METPNKKPTLLVIVPSSDTTRDAIFSLVVAETGEGLASHLCSHSAYAAADLILQRPERIEKYTKRFGEYDVKFIDRQNEVTYEELLKRNKEFHSKETDVDTSY